MIKRKKIAGQQRALSPPKERIALIIANRINQVQHSWASWMSKKAQRMDVRSKWAFFLGYSILMLGISTYVSVAALEEKSKVIDSTVPPRPRAIKANPVLPMSSGKPDQTYLRIQRFKKMLDSMSRTKEGGQMRDSILKSRPGLLDSIMKIEKMYQQLNKQ